MSDYIWTTDRMFFKHEISENLPCGTYSMHTHNAYELFFGDGDATHVIEDRKYKLKKGDLTLIRPFRYHFIQIDAPARYERYEIPLKSCYLICFRSYYTISASFLRHSRKRLQTCLPCSPKH